MSSAKTAAEADIAATYNEFKEFEGRRYTGMKIGRSHTWQYEPGEWKETKISPDQWQIAYAVKKRRRGKAPEGSGVPVGTQYHWYIVAHQNVTKLNANEYTTSMTGMKFKLAHKRADKEAWSASGRAQRRRLIKIFQSLIDELEQQDAADMRGKKTKTSAKTEARSTSTTKSKRARKPAAPRKGNGVPRAAARA